ncbi:MAG: A/G-specific adenine glycosylase [Rhodospirillaceae bacterium]|nr:A/G-specific adenine glycosylase [Rhodospirillaceae bacterium]MBL6930906.1 A/G-specific adenine glycosylase [Rhodospirillales bacterium]MBL6942128.1 A/G-specific adenine glycosylase [Rhodospirillales bacterium]
MRQPLKLTTSLLDWYRDNRRDLPWRTEDPDPYRVWLSEIMLQQTTVAVVRSYFEAFTGRWPTLDDLAAAELDAVLHAWQGLGYYARARNLHRCAKVLVTEFGGRFPESEKELLRLPGIGAYTAAAITAIAFGQPSAPVDGNIARVIARLMKLETPLPGLRRDVGELLAPLIPAQKPGDMVQALMDLGSAICKPGKPLCDQCPWRTSCAALKAGVVEQLPVKAAKKIKPVRHGVVFWIEDDESHVLLRRRPEKGLLGGMMEIPSSDWREKKWRMEEAIKEAPVLAEWQTLPGTVRHTFTHFHLHLIVLSTHTHQRKTNSGVWCTPNQFSSHALPSVMKKVIRHVVG